MKKSIIYIAVAVLTLTQGVASESVMTQDVAGTTQNQIDTLKSAKIADSFADNNLLNPETVFIRKDSRTINQVIAEDIAITETTIADAPADFQYPVMTNVEVSANNQIIDAELPAFQALDFSIIDQPLKVQPIVIKKPRTFTASL
jgi:CO dehydrogenase/acetyl-CoA synthase gamma subunit (corrinoid Fe-S protein)